MSRLIYVWMGFLGLNVLLAFVNLYAFLFTGHILLGVSGDAAGGQALLTVVLIVLTVITAATV